MRTIRKIGMSLCCGVALLGCLASTASAQEQTSPAPGPSLLMLTLRDAHTGALRSWAYLNCHPTAWGYHPDPQSACADIEPTDGDLTRLAHEPAMACVLIYLPVHAEAYGVWNGRPVRYRQTFSNDCVAAAATSRVFDF